MIHRFTLNAGGRERPRVLANVTAFVDKLPDTKSWRIEIREASRERSLDQNSALWGVAYPPICMETGYDADELHAAFCRKFFGTVEVMVLGEKVTRARRTTTTNEYGERDVIDRGTFVRFYDMVQRIAAELNIEVPDPSPFWREKAA
ncbi:hypothetical protein [Luteibacter yeojuensis]|uniref:NinB protein n=1 Tax=Luteibacter yeojuensis TaxID=345309 RepID=A0A7X5TP02_9GAMM|nr:hypothetical protein [Luteibacter yeojuensis]NID14986.1 hypothetical protein [Luteibacter yeojuensis]